MTELQPTDAPLAKCRKTWGFYASHMTHGRKRVCVGRSDIYPVARRLWTVPGSPPRNRPAPSGYHRPDMSGSSSRATTGLSCPQRGQFYVCADSAVRFVGCCRTDPCARGGVCADGDLGPAAFSADDYAEIPPQDCPDAGALWYTCKFTSPPFLGCCASNPCAAAFPGGCPSRDLRAARLSDSDFLAGPFLGSSSATTSPASTSTSRATSAAASTSRTTSAASTRDASPTASAAAAPSPSPRPPDATATLPVGAIAGVAIGGFALFAVIGFLAWRLLRQKRRARAAEVQGDQMTVARGPEMPPPSPPYSPYKGSFTSSPTVVGASPSSPSTAAWSPHSPQSSQGWASPGPEQAASIRPMSELAGSDVGYNGLSVQSSRAR